MKKLILVLLFAATPAWSMWTSSGYGYIGDGFISVPINNNNNNNNGNSFSRPPQQPVQCTGISASGYYGLFGKPCNPAPPPPRPVPPPAPKKVVAPPPPKVKTYEELLQEEKNKVSQQAKARANKSRNMFASLNVAIANSPAIQMPKVNVNVKGAGWVGATLAAAEILNETAGEIANDEIELLQNIRDRYENNVQSLEDKYNKMKEDGPITEEEARELHHDRDIMKINSREETPDKWVKIIEDRNMDKYENPLGPTIEWLRKEGKSWDEIARGAFTPDGKDLKGQSGVK